MDTYLIESNESLSGYKYITWNNSVKEWVVRVPSNSKRTYLGSFKDIEDAKNLLRNYTRLNESYQNIESKKSKSGIKGVHWHKASGKWAVLPKVNGKTTLVGYYFTIEQAKHALTQFLEDGQRWTLTPDKPVDITIKSTKEINHFDTHQLKALREYLSNTFMIMDDGSMVYRNKFWGRINKPVRNARVNLDGVTYTASKIAYLIHTGHYVRGRINSLDGNPLNCALDNLRPVHRLDRRFDDKFKSTTFI